MTYARWWMALIAMTLLLPMGALAQDEPSDEDEAPADEPDEAPADEPDEAPADEPSGPASPPLIQETETREIWPDEVEEEPAPTEEAPPVVVETVDAKEAAEQAKEPEPGPAPEPVVERPVAKRYLGLALSFGGSRHAMLDEGWQDLTGREQLEAFQWSLDVSLLPRLAVSIGGTTTSRHTIDVYGGEGALELRPRVSSLDVSARFIPSPPSFPVRGFVRAGGGFVRVHVEAVDTDINGNLRQRDHRGATPYALLGGGLEIVSPHRVKDRVIPFAFGFAAEGGARLGGGGATPAAPSVDLQGLGRLDLGPMYVRFSLVASVVLTPRKYAALVPSMTGR
ncbi:MAG: hypothetical protein GY898_21075 [Proteobacteria bacterium]|nr:hypothetical protein [Pseudomonadota bacterium]